MKALVKKYNINAKTPEQNEVYIEPQWHDWVKSNGSPLTDENYAYALCQECPEGIELTADDFDVFEYTKEVEDDMGEKTKVKYWIAKYIGGN